MIVRNQLRINCDQRAKITAGFKDPNKTYPKSVDYFLLKETPSDAEFIFPEIKEIYGEKPTEFVVSFPSDNYEDFYQDNYVLWGKNQVKKRKCNGVEVEIYYSENISNDKQQIIKKLTAGTVEPCICKELNLFNTDDKELKKACCKCDMYIKAYILDNRPESPRYMKPINPLCYLFSTHSINSADNIFSTLQMFRKFLGYPFVLSVKQVKTATSSFPIFNLAPYITANNLLEYNMHNEININQIEEQKPLQLQDPKYKQRILSEVSECNSFGMLREIWEKNESLQTDTEFSRAVTKRKKFIEQKYKGTKHE